jgi:hypothetical protein
MASIDSGAVMGQASLINFAVSFSDPESYLNWDIEHAEVDIESTEVLEGEVVSV